MPKSDPIRLWAHQLQLTIADWVAEAHDTHHPIAGSLYYEDQKDEAKRRAADFTAERIPKYLGYFERILKRNSKGGGYLLGKKISYVDLSLFQMIEGLRYAFPRAMARLEPKHPLLDRAARSRRRAAAIGRVSLIGTPYPVQSRRHLSPLSRARWLSIAKATDWFRLKTNQGGPIMAIELYWGSGSPFAWRVMLTLEVKKLAYESKLMEFSKGEHKTPAYLQLNPRGKVPTLKDGDFAVYESIAIMAYLDRKYPEPPLFGKTPEETGLIWQTISECEVVSRRRGQQGRPAGLLRQGFGQGRRDSTSGADDSPRVEIHRCAPRPIELAGRRADFRGGYHCFSRGAIAFTRGIQRGGAAAQSRFDAVVANLSEPRPVGSAN